MRIARKINKTQMKTVIDRHYLSEKISVARWKPEGVDRWSDRVVTGSWDNGPDNRLALWWLPGLSEEQQAYDTFTGVNTPAGDVPALSDHRPVHDGDVTDIKFLNTDTFAYGTTDGNLYLMKIAAGGGGDDGGGGRGDAESDCRRPGRCRWGRLHEVQRWEGLHELRSGNCAACSTIDTMAPDLLVTGGEDGRLALLSVTRPGYSPLAVFGSHQGASVKAVCFVCHNEIVAGTFRGLLKVWDVRSPSGSNDMGSGDAGGRKAAATFPFSREGVVPVTALASFPDQRHLLVAGGDNGAVVVWDLRKSSIPLLVFNAHDMSVNQVHFHHNRSSNLFTCSETGEIWQWHNFNTALRQALPPPSVDSTSQRQSNDPSTPGLGGMTLDVESFSLAKPEVEALLGPKAFPTNTVDVNQHNLLGASDSESIVIIRPLVLR